MFMTYNYMRDKIKILKGKLSLFELLVYVTVFSFLLSTYTIRIIYNTDEKCYSMIDFLGNCQI